MRAELDGYPEEWREALTAYLACARQQPTCGLGAARSATWTNDRETAPPAPSPASPSPWSGTSRSLLPLWTPPADSFRPVEWTARVVDHALRATAAAPPPRSRRIAQRHRPAARWPGPHLHRSALLRRHPVLGPDGLLPHLAPAHAARPLSRDRRKPSPSRSGRSGSRGADDGELIDDASRFEGDRAESKRNYEDGMARAFVRFHEALRDDGRLVVVFANKSPDAWETMVSALIRSGFVVTGSWPIQTEMQNRQRAMASAALSSSIWLVCRKRPRTAGPGWEGRVLADMRERITHQLHDFWDAGIRGPDFVWSATGPALEAFSRHPVVRSADRPGEKLTVAEFLRSVRRMVVGFVVSRLLARQEGSAAELDDITTYYLLHRSDFGLGPAPAGACILYALSCNLSDAELAGRHDLLARGRSAAATDLDADAGDAGSGSASDVRLKRWKARHHRDLGRPSSDGSAPPLIDCVHNVMHLWRTGEEARVNAYLDERGLRRNELFASVVQAVLEMAEAGSGERALLESVQNHLRGEGVARAAQRSLL